MEITKNFSRPLTLAELNGELSSIHAELIDVAQNGPEGVELYFSRCNGCVDCLRLTAQRGPQRAPALCVEYLPYTEEDAAESPADDAEDAPQLAAKWDAVHGGYYIVDVLKNTVVAPGPLSRENVNEWWEVPFIEAADEEDDTEE